MVTQGSGSENRATRKRIRSFMPTTIASRSASASNEYVLGTGRDESDRLGLQHRLWSAASHKLWERAGIRPGMSVLDAGCGPGFAAMDLAQIVGPRGRVVGIDESPGFLKALGEEAKARHMTHVERVLGDVQQLETAVPGSRGAFDMAYVRWVLCFVPRPADVVKGLAALVKPGGRVAIQDYFNYEHSIKIAPRDAAFERVIAGVAASFRARGGNPDIFGELPGMLLANGFEISHFDVVQRTARPPAAAACGLSGGDTMWHWPDTFFRTFTPKLVEQGFITGAERDAGLAAWNRACGDPAAFVLMPSVFELVAIRK